jgi:imidazolonepropionase-like amidohydrolase
MSFILGGLRTAACVKILRSWCDDEEHVLNETVTAYVGGTLYVGPRDDAIPDGVVLVTGGIISAVGTRSSVRIPASAHVVDCSQRIITAGFWNSHVHFFERKWANAAEIPAAELQRQLIDMLTGYGFTSVFDLSSMWENTRQLRDRLECGEVGGPRIRSTGEGLLPPGALPPEIVNTMMGMMKIPMPEVADATQAAAVCAKLLDGGVDGIKLFLKSPSPTAPPFVQGGIEACVRQAHAKNRPVFIHPNTGADVLAAVQGGADIIGHTTPHSGIWEDSLVATMKKHDVALTPTLTVWKYYMRHDRISTQQQITTTALHQLRSWLAADGTVLFGNDLGAVEYDPTEEYMLMQQAGMSFRQVLASLTTAPAERFNESHRLGRIASGFQADLVVLNSDPSKNLRALTDVRYTIRDGKIIYDSTATESAV